MKYKLGAVIPTTQYGNLQPEIELEGDDLGALHAEAMKHIEGVWSLHGSSPLTKRTMAAGGEGSPYVEVETFTGEKVLYDAVAHVYRDLKGNLLLSGSKYADQFAKPFDSAAISARTAKSWGCEAVELAAWWSINARISTEYGSTIHSALEGMHRFGKMGAAIAAHKGETDNYCLPKNAHLRNAVVSFVEKFGFDALSEVFVSDVANKRVGQIDRLAIIDAEAKTCRIGDYKSNFELPKEKIAHYQQQLSFYAGILEAKGWTVLGLDLYHFTGDEWEHHELAVLPITEANAVAA